MSTSQLSIVLSTVPDRQSAEKIAAALIEKQQAACVNILPSVTSIYRWKGSVERSEELLLIIKYRSDQFETLSATIKENHPYEVPEILSIPSDRVSESYLKWALAETSNSPVSF